MKKPKNLVIQAVSITLLSIGLVHSTLAASLNDNFANENEMAVMVDQYLLQMQNDVRIKHVFFANNINDIRAHLMSALCTERLYNCAQGYDAGNMNNPVTLHLQSSELAIMNEYLHQASNTRTQPTVTKHKLLERLADYRDNSHSEQPIASL